MQCVRYLAKLNNERGGKNVQDVHASRLTVRQLKNKYIYIIIIYITNIYMNCMFSTEPKTCIRASKYSNVGSTSFEEQKRVYVVIKE